MKRCLDLAAKGAGSVAPNPMVGAVLVFNEIIIGEGYHEVYGAAHAEVNCLNAVLPAQTHLIPLSTLYVSLEPCAHFGKTPPCADLIIQHKIPRVVIGCRDPFKEVNGKGIEKLKSAGIEVISGVLESACREMNKRFLCFHTLQRPYIILKWAQSANGKIAGNKEERIYISNTYSNTLVHKWRSEEAAILVGTRTALTDNPVLNTRHWPGKPPVRIVLDLQLRLPVTLQLFNQQQPTVVLNFFKNETNGQVRYYQLKQEKSLVAQICDALYALNIQSVLVEGGAQLLQTFIDAGCFDEWRIITNQLLEIPRGLSAPVYPAALPETTFKLDTDTIALYRNKSNEL